MGNPFRLTHATQGEVEAHRRVVEQYRDYLEAHPELVDALADRHPTALACWCPPLPCHAEVLAQALESRAGR